MSRNQLILSELDEGPASTPTLIALFAVGYRHPRQEIWNRMRWLESQGLVRKVRRVRGKATTWRAV